MTRRQSARSHSSINYAKIGVDDNASDDDFAESTPPKKRVKLKKEIKATAKSKSSRLPEKAKKKFEEEIQKALELSLSASQGEKSAVQTSDTELENKVESDVSNRSGLSDMKGAICNVQDEIEVVSKEDSKKSKLNKNDDDYQLSDSIESDSDEKEDFMSESDDGAESDNSFSKPKAKLKRKTMPKNNKPTKSTQKKTSVKIEAKKPTKGVLKEQTNAKHKLPARPSVPSVKTYHTSPVSPLPQRKWNPPGLAGCSSVRDVSSTKSPSTLRIGLSRNVRLKPLHPAASTKT
uniref:Uncharacterized protein LOC100182798 n=1 Tax=Phallusia mammillata TaxID=59560 RepID=A0A6F9DIG9_9ASCI|nr:uncharacterized protein LOC100182798 [Phallusia mammillata]